MMPLRIILFSLFAFALIGGGTLSQSNSPQSPVLENERVRAFEVTLEPGQSTSMHTHVLPGLAIALTPGDLEVITQGKNKPDRLNLPLGDLRWRAGAVTHTIKNVGKSRFEAV